MNEEKNTIKSSFEEIKQKITKIEILVIFLMIISFILFFYFSFSKKENSSTSTETGVSINYGELYLKIKQLPIEAEAVFVWDMYNQKEIFSKNKEQQLPLASLSKIMTALVASDYEDKNLIVKLDKEKWNLKNLLDFTLISSSNSGAAAVASAIQSISNENGKNSFVEKMNKKTKELGLKQTYFLNESGLDIDEEYLSGSYGSARDITMLFDYIIKNKPEILEATSYKKLNLISEDKKIHDAENTNTAINDIPLVIASKTGYTDLAGGNLVVVFDNGMMRPIIVSVLGSSKNGRFEDVKKIVNIILEDKNNFEK